MSDGWDYSVRERLVEAWEKAETPEEREFQQNVLRFYDLGIVVPDIGEDGTILGYRTAGDVEIITDTDT